MTIDEYVDHYCGLLWLGVDGCMEVTYTVL